MKIGVSYGSDKIYMGNTKTDKAGLEIWINKEDVTDQAVKAVFHHMHYKAEETGTYQISLKGFGKMIFVREDETDDK